MALRHIAQPIFSISADERVRRRLPPSLSAGLFLLDDIM